MANHGGMRCDWERKRHGGRQQSVCPFGYGCRIRAPHRTEAQLPAVAAAMVMHATGRCESEGLDSQPGQHKGGSWSAGCTSKRRSRSGMACHLLVATQPVTLPATFPSLRIVASDNKVPIGRDALPLEGRAVG